MTATNKTLETLVELGNLMSTSSNPLERKIWDIKAEAVGQLGEACQAYVDARAKNSTTTELTRAVYEASQRLVQLDNFWEQARAMQNRAAKFGNIDQNPIGEVMRTVLANMDKSKS